jgi:hypothetical protein
MRLFCSFAGAKVVIYFGIRIFEFGFFKGRATKIRVRYTDDKIVNCQGHPIPIKMKGKVTLTTIMFLIISIPLFADVIPEPVVAKGIVPSHPVNIQMVSEVVRVNLSLDSSIVECTFHMRNWGKQTNLEVGFPIMNFYLWDNNYLNPVNKSRFDVMVKGKSVDKINIYVPDELKKALDSVNGSNRYETLDSYKNANKPWYLWRVHFNKNEDLTIVVRYRLPNGATKISRFFDYLLSTGAGWKGNIKDAKVIIRLNEVADVQILDIKPKQFYKREGDEIVWHFKNLKPTVKNDIYLEFETSKGAYKAHEALNDSINLTYIDGKKAKYSAINFDEVGSYHIKQLPNTQGVEFVIFTKAFIFKKFREFTKQSDQEFWKHISSLSIKTFENSEIEINGEHVSGDALYKKLNKIDSANVVTGNVKKTETGKRKITIATKQPLPSDEGVFQSAPQR